MPSVPLNKKPFFFFSIRFRRYGFLINLILWNGLFSEIWFWLRFLMVLSQTGNPFKIHIILTKTNMYAYYVCENYGSLDNYYMISNVDDDDDGMWSKIVEKLSFWFYLFVSKNWIVFLDKSTLAEQRVGMQTEITRNRNKSKIEFELYRIQNFRQS